MLRQEFAHIVLRPIVDGAARAAVEIQLDDKQVVCLPLRVTEFDSVGGRTLGFDLNGHFAIRRKTVETCVRAGVYKLHAVFFDRARLAEVADKVAVRFYTAVL